jgi:UDP-sugar transporter A1/2/3
MSFLLLRTRSLISLDGTPIFVQYIALSNLSAAIYQVTYQLKILTTAVCSVLLFGRRYSYLKWFALCILTVGVVIVQLPSGDFDKTMDKSDNGHNQLLGLTSIFVACISSAFAGCYFE